MTALSCEVSIEIRVSKSKVWSALTDPEQIKKYLFGTDAISDWKVGAEIKFVGTWNGKPYEDKGTILQMEKEELLKYSYWSNLSGREDVPENYQTITYFLQETNGKTIFRLTQENCFSEEMKKHSEENWNYILSTLKHMLEAK